MRQSSSRLVAKAGRWRSAVLLFALALGPMAACSKEPELPVYRVVPEFEMRDQTGAVRHAADFKGRPFIAAFVFTRCTSICPMLTTQMVNLQRRLDGKAANTPFVAFSVDPTFDTPEILAGFAEERGANRNFVFLTGDFDSVVRVAREGFMVAVDVPRPDERGGFDIAHAPYLLLVDGELQMRGFYRTDSEGLEKIEHDLDRLLSAGD